MYSLCGSSVDNLGQQKCDKAKGVLRKPYIFNGSIDEADYATNDGFLARMIANSLLTKTDPNKVFPMQEVQDLADTSEANKEGSLNLGFKATLLEGKPAYTAKFFAGSDLLKRLRTFNNQIVRIIELDANGVFWGTKVGNKFKGFQAKIFVTGGRIATGQNVEEGVVTVTISILSVSEYIDNAYWIETPAGGNVEDIIALLDVNLKYISNAANVFKIGMYIPGSNAIGDYNIFDAVGAAIAAMAADFSAGTGANYGTNLAITSIVVDNTLKCLTVTFDSTAYTALANGTKIKLNPPTPAELDDADVTETELLPVILTKAA